MQLTTQMLTTSLISFSGTLTNLLKRKNMKKIIKLSALAMSLFMVACLEDDKLALDPSGYDNVLEFYNIDIPISVEGAVHPAWSASFPVALPGETVEFDMIISFSGPQSNTKNIDVELEVNPFALNAYNAEQGKTYTLLPDAYYSFPTSVTIPKGEAQVHVPVTVHSDLFDLSLTYALPVTITGSSSGLISSNFGTAIFVTVAKNAYDGKYHSTGFFQHPSSPRAINQDKKLTTTSADTNLTGHSDLGTPFFITTHPDNSVTFTEPNYGTYDKGTITVNGEEYSNTYNPTTRTYYLYYEYIGGTGPRTIYEKLVFLE